MFLHNSSSLKLYKSSIRHSKAQTKPHSPSLFSSLSPFHKIITLRQIINPLGAAKEEEEEYRAEYSYSTEMGSPNLRSSLITLRSSHSIYIFTLFITANSLNQRDHFVIIEKCITIRITHNSLKVIFQRSPVHERNHCALLGNNTGIGRGCERTVYCSHQPRRRAAAAS